MKMQISTAVTITDELYAKIAQAATDDEVIELSPEAEALIRDTVARDELDKAIDEAE